MEDQVLDAEAEGPMTPYPQLLGNVPALALYYYTDLRNLVFRESYLLFEPSAVLPYSDNFCTKDKGPLLREFMSSAA